MPSTDQYLNARNKIVNDLKDAVIGCDWQSDEEKTLNYNPLYHFVSGIIYPLDQMGSGYLEKQSSDNNLNDDEASLDEQHEEVESNLNSKTSRFTDDEDEDPLEEKNIIDQSTQYRQSSCGINFITSVNEEIHVKYGFFKI